MPGRMHVTQSAQRHAITKTHINACSAGGRLKIAGSGVCWRTRSQGHGQGHETMIAQECTLCIPVSGPAASVRAALGCTRREPYAIYLKFLCAPRGFCGAAWQAARGPEGTPLTGASGGLPGYPLGPPQAASLPHTDAGPRPDLFPQTYHLETVVRLKLG